jgi:hypothetical protein
MGEQTARLPNDQWKIELSSWFETGLAGFQQGIDDYASGPPNLGSMGYIEMPEHNSTQY